MNASLALLLVVAAVEPKPVVALLPLQAAEGTTDKQAAGATALVRATMESADFLNVVPAKKDDARAAARCGVDTACLAREAAARAADALAGGTVRPAANGLRVDLIVVGPDGDALRATSIVLGADGRDEALDRLVRAAYAPATLAGGILVVGEDTEGARILVDAKEAGTGPLDGPVTGLVEGDHTVEVEKPGFQRFRKVVEVRHKQVTTVKVVLLRALAPSDDVVAERPAPWGPIALVATGGASIVAGGVLGALSLRDALDVEDRAKQQLLVFPRDQALLDRGFALAVGANVAYAIGVAAIAGGAAWWFVALPPPDEARPAAAPVDAPAPGAPTSDELAPATEDLR